MTGPCCETKRLSQVLVHRHKFELHDISKSQKGGNNQADAKKMCYNEILLVTAYV